MPEQVPPARRTLLDAYKAMLAKLDEKQLPRLTTRPFVDYAWDKFDVAEVLSILSSPQRSYRGHKEVLFAGLCAWVACPSKPVLVRNAITLTAARFLNAAEKAGREKYQDIPQLGDIYIRLNQIGYEFLEDIYYPIGGLSRLANSPSIKGFQKQLRKKAYGCRFVIAVMGVYHYHTQHFSDRKTYGPASLNKASSLIFYLSPEDNLKERMVKKHRASFRDSAALAYAASRIIASDESSLLTKLSEAGRHSTNTGM